jgi:hypothetical protein
MKAKTKGLPVGAAVPGSFVEAATEGTLYETTTSDC